MDKEYWKYQKLLWKVTWNTFIKHFEGVKKFSEPIIVALLTFFCSIGGLAVFNRDVKINDWGIIATSVIGGPLLYAFGVLLYKRGLASYSVFTEGNKKFEDSLKERDLELEKYNWRGVTFWATPFSIIGKTGWAFKIENKKHYDICQAVVEITNVRKGDKNLVLD